MQWDNELRSKHATRDFPPGTEKYGGCGVAGRRRWLVRLATFRSHAATGRITAFTNCCANSASTNTPAPRRSDRSVFSSFRPQAFAMLPCPSPGDARSQSGCLVRHPSARASFWLCYCETSELCPPPFGARLNVPTACELEPIGGVFPFPEW